MLALHNLSKQDGAQQGRSLSLPSFLENASSFPFMNYQDIQPIVQRQHKAY